MISDEAVEAAAKAAAKDDAEPNWYLETERFRDAWRIRMRAALEAAAPHMLADVWDEGEAAGQDNADSNRGYNTEHKYNPYRSQA